jgi:predicted nucleic acid-binding protein
MAFVLDASIAAVWALSDEASERAETAHELLKNENALVPRIWWYEVRNLLVVNERRKRITAADTAQFLALLASYPIQVETLDDEEAIFRAARQYRLSFYDAAYFAVSQRHHLPLATLDGDLEAAAVSAGIPLVG